MERPNLQFFPATLERWDDLFTLFNQPGDQNGCWCMFWRIKRQDFDKQIGTQNKIALHDLIKSGHIPGIIGYWDERPVAWCSIAPRQEFGSLERSPVLKRVDARPVWSIVCFFITHDLRGQEISLTLVSAAIDYAKDKGAEIIEAYPLILEGAKRSSDSNRYTGIASTFLKAGFVETSRRSHRRVVMRYYIRDG
jgi:GNAT superfamily N-acetyltransferase